MLRSDATRARRRPRHGEPLPSLADAQTPARTTRPFAVEEGSRPASFRAPLRAIVGDTFEVQAGAGFGSCRARLYPRRRVRVNTCFCARSRQLSHKLSHKLSFCVMEWNGMEMQSRLRSLPPRSIPLRASQRIAKRSKLMPSEIKTSLPQSDSKNAHRRRTK